MVLCDHALENALRTARSKLNRAIDATNIKPAIGATFAFDQARQAFEYQASPELFGKVVIRVD